nr:MAG TPA: hypothetical protein [Caudoviricetes sp.]
MTSGNRPLFFLSRQSEDVKSCIVSSPDVKREYRVMA